MTLNDNIPDKLKIYPNWVCYRLEDTGKPKPGKIPYDPNTGRRAKANVPKTWGTFEQAVKALKNGNYDGIGFEFFENDPFTGVDLDHCVENGAILPWAQENINRLNSYAELSPSGTGVHIYIEATKPAGRCKKGNIEIYVKGRFLTITGDHLPNTPITIEKRQEELDGFYAEVFDKGVLNIDAKPIPKALPAPNISDVELIEKAIKAKNGAKFKALWEGDISSYNNDDSSADQALCNILAYWTGKDHKRIDSLFRQSRLYRDKWDERRGEQTYGDITIEKAIEGEKEKELKPIPIHLIDLENSSFIGITVCTDIIVTGIGKVFHVPIEYEADCGHSDDEKDPCPICPNEIKLPQNRNLINCCRMSDQTKIGMLRSFSKCKNKPKIQILNHTTITELLVIPRAEVSADIQKKDYRDKIIYFNGTVESSNIPYRAIGQVLAEPKKQEASMLVTKMERLSTAIEDFRVTPATVEEFKTLIPQCDDSDENGYLKHQNQILDDITYNFSKIYGEHRKRILLTELLTFHSPLEIIYNGETIKGTLDVMIIGDSGEGKTTQMRRIVEKVHLGKLISACTSSRTGVLYNLDNKINDKRILRWGEYPLAHQGLLAIDEGQKLPLEQWEEFTTARERGILEVNRSIRGEHPCRVRLIVFANPLNNKPMSQYQYGIEVLAPGNGFLRPADLRRFDLIGIVNSSDQDISEITKLDKEREKIENKITPEILRNSILWAWKRKKDDYIYGGKTPEVIRDVSSGLIGKYMTTGIPLIVNDIPEKLTRIGFSFASLYHSTDQKHEKVILKPIHIFLACNLIESLYDHQNCSFDQYVKVIKQNSNLTDAEYEQIKKDFFESCRGDAADVNLNLFELYMTNDGFSRSEIEALLGVKKDAITERVRLLRQHKLITSGKRGYTKTARMINFLRKWCHEKNIK